MVYYNWFLFRWVGDYYKLYIGKRYIEEKGNLNILIMGDIFRRVNFGFYFWVILKNFKFWGIFKKYYFWFRE